MLSYYRTALPVNKRKKTCREGIIVNGYHLISWDIQEMALIINDLAWGVIFW